jgi:hypothetical protein
VSGKGGIVFDSADCGESMGEKSYSDLKGEVASLKTVVSEQQSEMSDVMNAMDMMFGYGGNSGYYGPAYDPSYDPHAGRCAWVIFLFCGGYYGNSCSCGLPYDCRGHNQGR